VVAFDAIGIAILGIMTLIRTYKGFAAVFRLACGGAVRILSADAKITARAIILAVGIAGPLSKLRN
jgi:hypothetical protein